MLDEAFVRAVADELNALDVDHAKLGEEKHLKPAVRDVLERTTPGHGVVNRYVSVPYWPRVGNTDVVVLGDVADPWLGELKWGGVQEDVLHEAVWDALKLVLVRRSEIPRSGVQPRAYLLYGADRSVWDSSPFRTLFADAEHDIEELFNREIADKRGTLAWDDLVKGGRNSYPSKTERTIRTVAVATAAVGNWDLRAAEVLPVVGELIPMPGGWPEGRRPAKAEYPKLRRVKLIRSAPGREGEPGELGSVTYVASDGSLLVDWDSGCEGGALIPGMDEWDELTPERIADFDRDADH